MQRSRFRLPQASWDSLVTKYPANSPQVGPDAFTDGSKNFDTDIRGIITKRPGDVNYEPSAAAGTIKDLYESIFSDGVHHLLRVRSGELEFSSGGGSFSSVTAGYSSLGNFEFASYLDRVYFGNGIDSPQVYDRTASYGGVAYTAPKTKVMGAQAPGSALTAAVGAAGNVPAGTYTYKVTFLYYDFEESNGGTTSGAVNPGVGSQINLTSIPVGGYGVTARKIYRSGDGGLSYKLVLTISNNTATSGTDNLATGTTSIPTDNGTPRNFTLVVQHKDRLWIAGIPGDKADLDYSDAGKPDIFPTTNTVLCDSADPISGLVVYNDRVIVFNRNSFGQILGTDPLSFRYAEIAGKIGCVDNRTIRIRVFKGIPVLVWLSDKGFYAFNGSSVDYISDEIENLINFSIQQVSQTNGSVSQSSQSAFQGGTSTGGIDLISNPGAITTPNPKNSVSDQTGWEGGSTVANIVTRRTDIPNQLAMAKKNTFDRASGSNNGTQISGGNIVLPTASDNTGDGVLGGSFLAGVEASLAQGRPISLARAGTIGTVSVRAQVSSATNVPYRVFIAADAGGQIGAILSESGDQFSTGAPNPHQQDFSFVANYAASAGQNLWIGLRVRNGFMFGGGGVAGLFSSGTGPSGFWVLRPDLTTVEVSPGSGLHIAVAYTFSQTAVPASGTWTSQTYDSGLYPNGTAISVTVNHSASYPAFTGGTTFVDASDNADMSSGTNQSVGNLNGNQAFSFNPTRRYWRLRISLTSSDDRFTPSITTDPSLVFPSSVTWIGASIDGTTDISDMNAVEITVAALPASTTASVVVQKSTAIGGPFTDELTQALALGLNTISLLSMPNRTQRYSRVKLVLGNGSSPTDSPQISSAVLKWTITANIFSSVIDTGNTPAGWDVFQSSFTTNGGILAFGMRADTVSANLTDDIPSGPFSPAFTTVTNGLFPAGVTVAKFVQWRATLTSTADAVPVIDSVTINWFISLLSSIRAASLFDNKTYFVSLAEFGQTTNSILLKLDEFGKWRVDKEQSIGTFSLFFSDPYYGAADVAQVRKFRSGTTDHGGAIAMDVRTKAFDFDDITKRKVIRQVFVVVGNTGGTYTVDYSVDGGVTYLPLVDSSGNTTFTVASNDGITDKRLVPQWGNEIQGKTIMVRVRELTTAEAELHEIHLDAYVREGDILNG